MAKKKKAKKAKKAELAIKKSLIREYVKGKGDFRISSESFDVLSDLVLDLCDEGMNRAKLNRRKTLQKQDF